MPRKEKQPTPRLRRPRRPGLGVGQGVGRRGLSPGRNHQHHPKTCPLMSTISTRTSRA